jgi:hypothetical protein
MVETAKARFALDERVIVALSAPACIVPVDRLIQRAAADRIRDRFAAVVAKLRLTGGGGEARPPCSRTSERDCHPGQSLIVYDCYREGVHLNANGYRPRAEDASSSWATRSPVVCCCHLCSPSAAPTIRAGSPQSLPLLPRRSPRVNSRRYS